MKQSLKTYLPILNEAITFSEFMAKEKPITGLPFIAHCEETNKQTLKEIIKPKTNVLICIGPEGDFSTSEIETALQNGLNPVHLGNSRLRTETAAIVACHSVAFLNEM